MKEFGVWYINYGWMIATAIAPFVGVYAAKRQSDLIVFWFIVMTIAIGCTAAFFA